MRKVKIYQRTDRQPAHYYIRIMVGGRRRYFDLGPDRDLAYDNGQKILARYSGAVAHVPARILTPGVTSLEDVCRAYLDARKNEVSRHQWKLLALLLATLWGFVGAEVRLAAWKKLALEYRDLLDKQPPKPKDQGSKPKE